MSDNVRSSTTHAIESVPGPRVSDSPKARGSRRRGRHRQAADEQAAQHREILAEALGQANKPGEAPTTEAGTDAEEQGAEQIDGLHRKQRRGFLVEKRNDRFGADERNKVA